MRETVPPDALGVEARFDRFMRAATADGRPARLYHPCDPTAPHPRHVWSYVYLHGLAERRNEAEAARHNYWSDKPADDDTRPWPAPDLFVSDVPRPLAEGDWQAFLYGHPVLIVYRLYRPNIFGGRAACLDDPEGFAHACHWPQEWR